MMKRCIIAVIALLALAGCSSNGVGFAPTESPSTSTNSAKAKLHKTAEAKPKMTKSQEQAVGSAESYLEGQHFSKKGLIHQLKYDGYPTKDAVFAVNYIHPNWNQQAAGTAKEYLDGQHFSHSGLIHQLKYDGYTQSQAEYGVEKAGL
jgi:hypothetical protein